MSVSVTSTGSNSLPSTAIDTLNAYMETIFPNIHTPLKIAACTLPVTTSLAERSFSSLRRLKNYLRSTIGAVTEWVIFTLHSLGVGYTLRQMKQLTNLPKNAANTPLQFVSPKSLPQNSRVTKMKVLPM